MANPSIDDLIANYGKSQSIQPTDSQKIDMQPQLQPQNNAAANFVSSVARGAAQPAIDLASGTENLLERGIHQLVPKLQVQPELNQNLQLAQGAADPTVAKIAGIGGSLALPGGELMAGARGLKALGTAAGLGAGYGASLGAASNPNSNPLNDALTGGALSAGLTGAMQAIPGLVGAGIKKSLNSYEKQSADPNTGIASPQLVQAKLNNTQGMPLDIGSLLNNPKLAEYYKNLSNVFGSQSPQRMSQTVNQANNMADTIVNHMWQTHDEPSAANAVLSHIKGNADFHNGVSEKMYNQLDDAAKNRNIDTSERPNSMQAAQDLLDNANEVEKTGGYNFLTTNPGLKKLVENISNGTSPVGTDVSTGQPIKSAATFQDLKNLRSYVGKQIGSLQKAPIMNRDSDAISGLGKIYYGLDADMGHNLNKADPDLYSQWQDASSYYKNNVKPYQKNPVINDLINSNTANGKALFNTFNSTNPKLDPSASQVVSHMDPTYQKMLVGLGMGKATDIDPLTGNVTANASKLIGSYKNLRNQPLLQQVFDQSDHNLFNKLQVMNDAAKEYRPVVNKPPTGYANQPMMVNAALAVPSILASKKEGVGGALGTLAATMMGSNKLSDLLASPDLAKAYAQPANRNALVQKAVASMGPKSKAGKAALGSAKALATPQVSNYLLQQMSNLGSQ